MSTELFIKEKNNKKNISAYLSIFDKFFYSDALCGAGKTYSTIKNIINLQKNNIEHHIDVIIVPTFILALQQKQNLIKQGYNEQHIYFLLSTNEYGELEETNVA